MSRPNLSGTAAGLLVFLGLVILVGVLAYLPARAAPSASCSDGNFPTRVEDDATVSGDLYVTDDILVRNDATLTITAGSHITMCGEYQLRVENGTLVASGTETDPILFDADDPSTRWENIFIIGISSMGENVIEHVELNNGGGNDETALTGAIHIRNYYDSPGAYPLVKDVTINDSGAFGLVVESDGYDDETPPALSGLTINNSARAPMLLDVAAVGGLGQGNTFTGNVTNTIQVGWFHGPTLNGHGLLGYSQIWRAQPVPYEITGDVVLRDADQAGDPATLTIEPGTSFLVHPDVGIDIGTLFNANTALLAEGTATDPITFTRLSETSGPWDNLTFGLDPDAQTSSRLSYVNVLYGGGTASSGARAAVEQQGEGSLILDHVQILHSENAGFYAGNGSATINDSRFELNRQGIRVYDTGVLIRNSAIVDNSEIGLLNETPDDLCVDALGNYWGASNGPADVSGAADACDEGRTNSGAGEGVSDGVLYEPWLGSEAGGLADRSQISPDAFWVIANGVDSATLTITARDGQGNPLTGKQIQVESTRGTVRQPTSPTDASGVTTAVISGTETGSAVVIARNVTDNEPLSAASYLLFWQGDPDTGGLIDLSGAPYEFPELVVGGKPFQEGYPITFKLPMRNANTNPVEVQVVYAVSGLNIGAAFTPVYTATETLQPGETWEAPGGWTPDVTGHHCVQARVEVTPQTGPSQVGAAAVAQSGFRRQQNLNVGGGKGGYPGFGGPGGCGFACMLPKPKAGLGGLFEIAKYFKNMTGAVEQNMNYLDNQLSEDPPTHNYEEIVTVPTYTPPSFDTTGMTQAQVDALNDYRAAAAQAIALSEAAGVTIDRMSGALTADSLYYAGLQREALSDFLARYGGALGDQADALDDLLIAMEDAGVQDARILPADYLDWLDDLRTSGFSSEESALFRALGLDDAETEAQRLHLVEWLERESASLPVTSVYEVIGNNRDLMRKRAQAVVDDYGPAVAVQAAGSPAATLEAVGSMRAPFVVGNPTDEEGTVELLVRPVDVPLNWTYSLDKPAPTLGAGETTTVTLTIDPGATMLRGVTARFAVEGYIDGEYVGGILYERTVPQVAYGVYLPLVVRGQ